MEDNGEKRGSGSHAEDDGGGGVERSMAKNEGTSKRKHCQIAEEDAILKRPRNSGKGVGEPLSNGLKSHIRRQRRQSSVSESCSTMDPETAQPKNNAENADFDHSDESSGTFHDDSRVGDCKMAHTAEQVDAFCCPSSEVPELSSCLEGRVVIPKRPRGAWRRKKSERLLMPRRAAAGLSDFLSSIEIDAHGDEEVPDTIMQTNASSTKSKDVASEVKKDPSRRSRKRVCAVADLPTKDEEFHDDITKDKLCGCKTAETCDHENGSQMDTGTHVAQECANLGNYADEEENLAHNAARMLSSRFDPRYTNTSDACTHSDKYATEPKVSRRRTSVVSFPVADATERLLRPRRQDFQGLVRKRRHFYEVHADELDSYLLLKKKIKVFCPLDHGWCFGVVNDYNPDTGLHLIKYESRDEEWADLRKERIKLLIFPSELCGNLKKNNLEVQHTASEQMVNEKLKLAVGNGSIGSLMDSEPIISYYTRLTQRAKKSTFRITRKKISSSSDISVSADGSDSIIKSEKFQHSCNGPDDISTEIGALPKPVNNDVPFDRRFSFMYSRKRFCKAKRKPQNVMESLISDSFHMPEKYLEFKIASRVVELEQGKLKLQGLCLLFLMEGQSFSRELLFPHKYAIVLLWPLVHVEIVFVDKVMGCRFISFDGSLGLIVVVLCMIMRITRSSTDYLDCLKMHMPCGLILCKFSGMQHIRRYPVLMPIIRDQGCLNWPFMEFKLSKLQILVSRHAAFTDCSAVTIKRLLGDADLVPHVSRIISLENCTTASTSVQQRNLGKVVDGSCSLADDSSDQVSEITLENTGSSQSHTADVPSHVIPKVEADALSLSSDDDWKRTSEDLVKSGPHTAENFIRNFNLRGKKFLRSQRQPRRSGSWKAAWISYPQFLDDISSPDKSDNGIQNYSGLVHSSENKCMEEQDANMSKSDMSGRIAEEPDLPSPGGKGFCIMQEHPVSPDFSSFSENLCADSPRNGYSIQYRKPRTQVQYSLPNIRYDSCTRSKSHKRKGHSLKKVKYGRTNYTRISSKNSRSYTKSFTCEANVLVIASDRGWRECAAQVVLDSEGQSWKLLVKLCGNTKYSYKADQFIQPGTTNRYTHAMIWKGESNWALEFTERNQWTIFKDMHEECYNRNIRAASVKNIPIPGVRLLEDVDSCTVGSTFARSPQYFHQVGNEIDLALHPSCIVYDIDSDDEAFLSKVRNLGELNESKPVEISDELFEKAIDTLEKFSFSQKCGVLSESEVERLLAEIGPSSVALLIYEHWRMKRERKGVALVRQFQPALWEQYQAKLKEWDKALSRATCSNNQLEKKLVEKPPMFAFCLKPRRVKVPNKSSNQRPQRPRRKFSLQNSCQREHDRTHAFGRRSTRISGGSEEASVSVPSHRSLPRSILPLGGCLSPCASNIIESNGTDGSEDIHHLTLHGSNPKKMGAFQSHRDYKMMEVHDQTVDDRSWTWNTGLPDCSTIRWIHSDRIQNGSSELEEFRLRDASSAAQHAINMAKLKREKAQWLFRKADLALHKATVALVTAEAIKASEGDLIGDG